MEASLDARHLWMNGKSIYSCFSLLFLILFALFFPHSVTRESLIAFSLGVCINEVGEFVRVQFLF